STQRLETGCELRFVDADEARGEADVVEPAGVIVEPEQQRADLSAVGAVAEAADDAICGADMLDLQHRAFPRGVAAVEVLADDAVDGAAGLVQPAPRLRVLARERGEQDAFGGVREKRFERSAALDQRG